MPKQACCQGADVTFQTNKAENSQPVVTVLLLGSTMASGCFWFCLPIADMKLALGNNISLFGNEKPHFNPHLFTSEFIVPGVLAGKKSSKNAVKSKERQLGCYVVTLQRRRQCD